MIQKRLSKLRAWWSRFGWPMTTLWLVVGATVTVTLYYGHKSDQCFKEYFSVQTYRAGKTDQVIDSVVKTVENQQQWTDELSHPPEGLWGNYGPERQAWLTDIGRRATKRSDELVAQIRGAMQDKADHPYPVVRCGR